MEKVKLDAMRLQLIEVASTRPDDVKMFYDKNLEFIDGCSFLKHGASEHLPLLYRGKLRHFDARIVPFALAGVDPDGPKICKNTKCINPSHVI